MPVSPERRVIVRFHERVELPYRAGPDLHQALLGAADDRFLDLRAAFPGVAFGPLFTAVPEARLQALLASARARMGAKFRDPGLLRFFQVPVPPGASAQALAEQLRGWRGLVEDAWVDPGPTLPPANVTRHDEPEADKQYYLEPARIDVGGTSYDWGVDAEYAWGVQGGDGAGQALVDAEGGWKLDHPDLPGNIVRLPAPPDFVNGDPLLPTDELKQRHGTNALGVVVAQDNALGVIGVAPGVPHVAVSAEYIVVSGKVKSKYSDAVERAVYWLDDQKAATGAAGVLLLEASHYDPSLTTAKGVPIEVRSDVFGWILTAVQNGHVVVEAAGNGGFDLDDDGPGVDQIDYAQPGLVDLSDPANDSGAILVGASQPPVTVDSSGLLWVPATAPATATDMPHVRSGATCFGARVDCYAWGDFVQTTAPAGYERFAHTSAASAIVAGVVLVLQGIADDLGIGPLDPYAVREMLRTETLGTPTKGGLADGIGVMPDLRKILQQSTLFAPHELVPDVYLRDHVGDTGLPHTGAVAMSPDIIVRQNEVPGAQAAFGESNEDELALSEPMLEGAPAVIYVRARNRGKADARDVKVQVYWSEVATLVAPNLWNPIYGEATFERIPRGEKLTVSSKLDWPGAAALAPGHYCFVAIATSEDDPDAKPASFPDFPSFVAFIRDHNNATWRNFNVIEVPTPPTPPPPGPGDGGMGPPSPGPGPQPDLVPVPFLLPGAFDVDRLFTVEISVSDPALTAVLELPTSVFQAFDLDHALVTPGSAPGLLRMPIPTGHVHPLGQALLPARSRPRVRLLVGVPPAFKKTADVIVRQLFEGEEVGRVHRRLCRAPRATPPGPA